MAKEFKIMPTHILFVEEFCTHGNQTLAYQKAFPNVTYASARKLASTLIKKPEIQELIAEKKEKLAVKYNITKELMIDELREKAELAFLGGQMSAYASIMNILMKIVGLYEPKSVDITSKGEQIVINLLLDDKD